MFESLTKRLGALNLRAQGGNMKDGVWYKIEDVKQCDGEGEIHLLMGKDTAVRLLRQAYYGDSPHVDNGIAAVKCMVTSSNTFEVRAKIGFTPSRGPQKIHTVRVECYIWGDPKLNNDKRIRDVEWCLKTDSGIWIDDEHRPLQHSKGGQHRTITQAHQDTPPPTETRHHEGSQMTTGPTKSHVQTNLPFSNQHGLTGSGDKYGQLGPRGSGDIYGQLGPRGSGDIYAQLGPRGSGDIYAQLGASKSQLSLPRGSQVSLLHEHRQK